MRRTAFHLIAVVSLGLAEPLVLDPTPPARAQAPAPVHAFLFGAWTGGLFPPPASVSAEQCLASPSVIFARDIVMHATFTNVVYIQRVIESVRGTGTGVDFHFAPGVSAAPGQGVPGVTAAGDQGFGCDGPDELRVQRLGANEISFPGCKAFPYRLVRCPAG